MGKLIQQGTQALGLTADPTTGEGAMKQSAALQERAVKELEKIGIPSIEAQKIVLERPELVLSTLEEKLGPSAMEDIQIDPRLQEAEMAALSDIQEAGKKGFTAEDRARIEALRSQIGADEQARQASILQGMAQRGTLDSGAQLAAQLGSSQAATQRASQEAIQLAAQQAAARRNALAQAGQMAGQMGSRQFGQQAQQAGASDAIKQFNAAVASRDTAARQNYAQQLANTANQQEMYNKGLIQQQFQNEMAKATGISGALGNQAQGAMNQAQMQAQAAQQSAAGMRGLVLGGAKAAAAFQDGGTKGMNYESGGEGTVIESLEDKPLTENLYVGDELPDRINEGEMVLNLDQQDTIAKLLKELGERRADEKVQAGEAVINEPQQDRLMAVAREEADPEELVDGGNIVEDVQETMPSQEGSEPIETGEYEKLLDALKMSQEGYEFADGGISAFNDIYTPYSQEPNMSVEPQLPYSEMMSKEQTPEEKALELESILTAYKPEENMSVGEPATPDYSQMMSVGEPADVSSISQANKIVESANAPKSDKPKIDEGESEQKTDEELRSAQNKDMLLTLLDDVDRALAHYDAANPNSKLTPVQRDRIKSNFEEKLLKARQMASQQADKKADREALTKYRQDTLVGQEQARKDLKEYRDKQLELAGKELEIKKDKATPEDKQLAKEQRKEQKELEKNLDDIKDKKEKIKKTLNTLKALEKENAVVDTGPLDQYVSNKTTTGRKLEQQFNELALDKMTKMFAGMSKAIDSDAEREFFMRSQPGMGQYSSNNKEILNDMLKGVESLEQKINSQLGKTPKKSESNKEESSKTKSAEIRRKTKDGRIAIFDENKNFLRYEN